MSTEHESLEQRVTSRQAKVTEILGLVRKTAISHRRGLPRSVGETFLDKITTVLNTAVAQNTGADVLLDRDPASIALVFLALRKKQQEGVDSALATVSHALSTSFGGYPGVLSYKLAKDRSNHATQLSDRLAQVPNNPYGPGPAMELVYSSPVEGISVVYTFPGITPPDDAQGYVSLRVRPLT